jgi:hypothetical protein
MEEIVTPVAPVEAPVTTPVTDPTAPVATEVAQAAQYALPDGKMVDAETLSREWKENFLPEYTRKSQELAAQKAKLQPVEEPQPPAQAPWANPEWQPGNYQELAEGVQQQVWKQILNAANAEEQQKQERDAYVQREIEEIKSLDPKADVHRVMSHAAKYAFQSLLPAFQNMKAMEESERRVEERVMNNMKARAQEPVGIPGGSLGGTPTFPPGVRTPMEKARWAIRNQK